MKIVLVSSILDLNEISKISTRLFLIYGAIKTCFGAAII